jgi:hypothetical protein
MNLIDKINEKLKEQLAKYSILELAEDTATATGETVATDKPDADKPSTETTIPPVKAHIVEKTVIVYTAVNEPVLSENDGAVEDGEYNLDNDKIITVKDGKLTDIKDVVETTEQEAAETKPSDVKLNTIELGIEKNRLADLVDLTKDGEYTISLTVSEGQIKYGNVYANTYQNLMMKAVEENETKVEEKMNKIIENYTKIIESLKMSDNKGIEDKPVIDNNSDDIVEVNSKTLLKLKKELKIK